MAHKISKLLDYTKSTISIPRSKTFYQFYFEAHTSLPQNNNFITPFTMRGPKYKTKFNKIVDDTCQILQPKLLSTMLRPRSRIFHWSSSNTCTWFRNQKCTIIYHQQCKDQDPKKNSTNSLMTFVKFCDIDSVRTKI
jgi:hypothetical protein